MDDYKAEYYSLTMKETAYIYIMPVFRRSNSLCSKGEEGNSAALDLSQLI